MASVNRTTKRQLYKPATSGSVSLDQKPRSLAQGILADSSTSWQEELSRSVSDYYSDDVIATVHEKKDRPKPKVIHEVVADSSSEERSPQLGQVSHTNKFQESGVVEDISTLPKPNLYRNEVLIVDASGPSLNPDTSEVSTTVHKVFSPVKVICHSPSPERQKHGYEINTLSGSYNVKVESPKRIVLGETVPIQSDINENAEFEQESTEKSSATETKQQDVKQKKKKKPPRVIQSRYMNPKDVKKKLEDDVARVKSTTTSFIHDISAIPASSIIEGPIKDHGTKKKKSKVTSTPFNPSSWSEKTRMIVDGSYLDVSKTMTAAMPDTKHDVAKVTKDTREKRISSKGLGAADSGISLGMQEHEEPVTEKQLTMKYCRMLQAMLLNAKARNTFAKQEEEAKQQIYNVWQENQRLKVEIKQLEQTCMVKKHAMILDQLLKIQDAGLKPIDESLDRLHSNYLTMGEALDSTRHYMPVEDVVVVGNEDKLISALKESQMLLAEISSHTSTKEPGIEQLATDVSHLVEKFYEEISEQSRCEELLIAAKSLTNHERSLQSQLLQSKSVSM